VLPLGDRRIMPQLMQNPQLLMILQFQKMKNPSYAGLYFFFGSVQPPRNIVIIQTP
jgi:hypothetical protein